LRQIVQTLGRMVPVRGLRRGVRQAILHRPGFADAMWILEVVAAKLGGDFPEAVAFWRSGVEVPRPEPSQPAHAEAAGEDLGEEAGPTGRRRRRRRRSRRRGKGAVAGPPQEPGRAQPAEVARPERAPAQVPKPERAPAERPAKREDLPSPWDDNYFFAALPTAPKLEEEDGDTDRYGAAAVVRGLDTAAATVDEDDAETPPPGHAPARKRRRRRRPRGGKPPDGGTSAPAPSE
jgi:hypothetical protein